MAHPTGLVVYLEFLSTTPDEMVEMFHFIVRRSEISTRKLPEITADPMSLVKSDRQQGVFAVRARARLAGTSSRTPITSERMSISNLVAALFAIGSLNFHTRVKLPAPNTEIEPIGEQACRTIKDNDKERVSQAQGPGTEVFASTHSPFSCIGDTAYYKQDNTSRATARFTDTFPETGNGWLAYHRMEMDDSL